jgi:hypothetical protein
MAPAPRRATASSRRSWPYGPESSRTTPAALPGLQLFSDALQMPFDAMRAQHAKAVHSGFMANSILESRDFEKGLDALEHICLGPFARHV